MYPHKEIDAKWQKYWLDNKTFKTPQDTTKKKKYILDMFPYPSGQGLHVGHPEGYTATDIYARYLRMNDYNVLHPMGWDAFGLPAENYAIKTGTHPHDTTQKNIDHFRKQLQSLGFSYDWDNEVNTTDPQYYRWTQWIFLQLYKKGLAYEAVVPINWCPSCKTGLANEETAGGVCDRCGTTVERKDMKQWMLKITAYAERLLNNVETLDWPESVKNLQKNWIGKSEGAQVEFRIKDHKLGLKIFTTRPDTLFGTTYMVLAPEHPIIENLKLQITNFSEVQDYIKKSKNKSDLERTDLAKEKTGIEIKGIKAINPVNNEEIPIWIADYVLISYGTGAIMAVPAHDQRDWEFATKFGINIKQVVAPMVYSPFQKDQVKSDKPNKKRKNAVAIIKHWSQDKYLCLNWEKFNWHSFIVGGVEEGETYEQAAIREMREESGYQNVKSVKKIGGEIQSKFFAAHKDVNVHGYFHGFLIELLDDTYIKPKNEEVTNHEAIWLDKDEVVKFLNLPTHTYFWDILINGWQANCEDGININSDFLDGLTTDQAKEKIINWLEENKIGAKQIQYKLRDWVFSRQRYWGEPIPLVHCEKCGTVPLNDWDLPLRLPEVKQYEPTGTGESPLANIHDWVNTTCPVCGEKAKRETNTMPQWAGSSWYWLRYVDTNNNERLADLEKLKYWLPVDVYVGGAEHAVLHLLYARFWNMVLFDLGIIPIEEPFAKLINQGLILGPDGEKMSKSRGNVINPDDVLNEYGADTFRLYEMFMGPLEDAKPWDTKSIIGIRRFLEKVYNLYQTNNFVATQDNEELNRLLHKTIKKVTDDVIAFKFNTAISSMMIFINTANKEEKISLETAKKFLIILSPFAPHLVEELWQKIGNKNSISFAPWPDYDKKLIEEETYLLIVQINGKNRDQFEVENDINQDRAMQLIYDREKLVPWIKDKEIKKIIFVPGRLINLVV